MDECICLKSVTFDRKYFHSATLMRPNDPAKEKYYGNLTLAINFIVPNIGGNQGILNTMLLKEVTPIQTIDLYLTLLEALRSLAGLEGMPRPNYPDKDELIEELLTNDEKALSKGAIPEYPLEDKPTIEGEV